jgi:hypothetical protein
MKLSGSYHIGVLRCGYFVALPGIIGAAANI